MVRRAVAALLVVAVIAGCRPGAVAPSDVPSPSAGGSLGTSPSASVATLPPAPSSAPVASATLEPSPPAGASPGPTPAPSIPDASPVLSNILRVPPDWMLYGWSDGVPSFALPPGWEVDDLAKDVADLRTARASASPDDARWMGTLIDLYDSGATRLYAHGPLADDTFPDAAWVQVTVERIDSGPAFVTRLMSRVRDLGYSGETGTRIETPIGAQPAIRYDGPNGPLGVVLALDVGAGRGMAVDVGVGDPKLLDGLTNEIAATLHWPAEAPLGLGPAPDERSAPAAIAESIARLSALRSYRFVTAASGRDPGRLAGWTPNGFSMWATLDRVPDLRMAGSLAYRMGESNGSGAAITTGGGFILGPEWGWFNEFGKQQQYPASRVKEAVGPFLPAAVLEGAVLPFASLFELVGREDHGGVPAAHYRATAAGASRYAKETGLDGTVTADLWIARNGGYLVGVAIRGVAKPRPRASSQFEDGFLIEVEISDVNDAVNVIELPPA